MLLQPRMPSLGSAVELSKERQDTLQKNFGKPRPEAKKLREEALKGVEDADTLAQQKKEVEDKGYDHWTTNVLTRNSDQRKYGTLMKRLRQDYSLGQDCWPKDAQMALNSLSAHPWDEAYNKNKKNQSYKIA